VSKKTGRRDAEKVIGVTFYAGVPIPDAMVFHVEQQKARCAQHGCTPNVRTTVGNIYFEHDDWCPVVGGKGQ
jgi:hypothetical protein